MSVSAKEPVQEPVTPTERLGARLILGIAIALHAIALLNALPLQSANDRSRWSTVWSLIERGTFQIDEIREVPGWDSIDKIYDEGHYYSTKPPLLTVVVAGVTWMVQKATRWTLLKETHAVTTAVLLIVNLVPFAISLICWNRLLRRVAKTTWSRWFVLATAAFGTLVTPYLMTLNNHTVAVASVMICLVALERLLSDPQASAWTFAVCGLSAAWACANELPAAAFGLATFLLAVRVSLKKTAVAYVPAALVPLIAFLVTNVVATGSWKPTYANFGTSKYNFVVDGVPSYWMDPDGVDRNLDPPWRYFLHCTIGHHGIFSLTPVFLLALVTWGLSNRIERPSLRTLVRLGIVLTALVLGFYMMRFDNYNFGGVSCGLRWALWLVPFWLVALVPAVDLGATRRGVRGLHGVLLGLSLLSAWLPIENPWQQPWLFRQMEARNWIDYKRPNPVLPRPLWTWFGRVPEMAPGAAPQWVEFTAQSADGSRRRRRVTCRPVEGNGDRVELEVAEASGEGSLTPVRKFWIDPARFAKGEAPANFLDMPRNPASTRAERQSNLTFVRGLPANREYKAGKVRYVFLDLRNDAFRCLTAAAAIPFPDRDETHQYRCDTWLCDEFPLGVAQYEIKVVDRMTGDQVHQERWIVTDCFPNVASQAPPPVPVSPAPAASPAAAPTESP